MESNLVPVIGVIGGLLSSLAAAWSILKLFAKQRAEQVFKRRLVDGLEVQAREAQTGEEWLRILRELSRERESALKRTELNEEELKRVTQLLDLILNELKEPERKLISEGLHQPSEEGRTAYIAKLLSQAESIQPQSSHHSAKIGSTETHIQPKVTRAYVRKVSRYLLFFSVVATLAIAGDLIASELLSNYPIPAGAAILVGVAILLAAVWIKDLYLLRVIVASKQRLITDEAMTIAFPAMLNLILLYRPRRHPTLERVLGIVAMITMYLLMAITLLYAVYLAVVVGGIGVVVAYAITLFIAVLIAPAALRARVIRLFVWVGVGSTAVWIALSLARYLRNGVPYDRGGIAVVGILSAFVLVNLLRFHRVDAFVARLDNWLRG